MSPWIHLSIAIAFEVAGTSALKASSGMSQRLPALLALAFYGGSLVFLSFATKSLSISVAYAVWSAVGLALISLIGLYLFNETFSVGKAVFLLMIGVGVIGLYSYE